jgi:hypothetical protein
MASLDDPQDTEAMLEALAEDFDAGITKIPRRGHPEAS